MSDRLAEFDERVSAGSKKKGTGDENGKGKEKAQTLFGFGFEIPEERLLSFDSAVRSSGKGYGKREAPRVRPSEQLNSGGQNELL